MFVVAVGAEFRFEAGGTRNVRFPYLARHTVFDVSEPTPVWWRYILISDWQRRHEFPASAQDKKGAGGRVDRP
jgi:hypothetical protein